MFIEIGKYEFDLLRLTNIFNLYSYNMGDPQIYVRGFPKYTT